MRLTRSFKEDRPLHGGEDGDGQNNDEFDHDESEKGDGKFVGLPVLRTHIECVKVVVDLKGDKASNGEPEEHQEPNADGRP